MLQIKKKHLRIIVGGVVFITIGMLLILTIQGQGSLNNVSSNTQVFTITAEKFKYTPRIIRVKQGDRVEINVENKDFNHGIYISGYNVIGEDKVTFVATKQGTFNFGCTLFCGSGHSEMTGQLIVE